MRLAALCSRSPSYLACSFRCCLFRLLRSYLLDLSRPSGLQHPLSREPLRLGGQRCEVRRYDVELQSEIAATATGEWSTRCER